MAIDKRVALVTGASRGIGRAIALRLARDGRHVVLMSRSEAPLNDLKGSIEANGGAASVSPCDVGDPKALAGAVEGVGEKLGRLDILVNNAGITRDNLFLRLKEEDWDAVLGINLKGAFHCIQAFSRGMLKARWGRIVNVTSVVGMMGNKGQANYAAAKAGLCGLTWSVAKEVAERGITVNAIAPGFITTDMTGVLPEAVQQELQKMIPMGRIGEPDEVAGAVSFLASDLAGYITGQVLRIDGGMLMG